MLIAYIAKGETCWTVMLEGVTCRLPTHTLLPLPWTLDAPWQAVAQYAHSALRATTVFYRGSQV